MRFIVIANTKSYDKEKERKSYERTLIFDYCHHYSYRRRKKEMENPPLWVWAIIVGIIIAGKYAYRWKSTKQLAKETEERKNRLEKLGKGSGSNVDIDNNNRSSNSIRNAVDHKYSQHKYNPNYYRDYFEMRKRKEKSS